MRALGLALALAAACGAPSQHTHVFSHHPGTLPLRIHLVPLQVGDTIDEAFSSNTAVRVEAAATTASQGQSATEVTWQVLATEDGHPTLVKLTYTSERPSSDATADTGLTGRQFLLDAAAMPPTARPLDGMAMSSDTLEAVTSATWPMRQHSTVALTYGRDWYLDEWVDIPAAEFMGTSEVEATTVTGRLRLTHASSAEATFEFAMDMTQKVETAHVVSHTRSTLTVDVLRGWPLAMDLDVAFDATAPGARGRTRAVSRTTWKYRLKRHEAQ